MIGANSSDNDQCQMFDMLDNRAQAEYADLKKAIQKLLFNCGKAKFTKVFGQVTELIEEYIADDHTGTHVRSLVCGYLKLNDFLAINTRQLISLTGKCKSSINSGLQSIGYKVIPMDAESAYTLMKTFPFMKNQINLTRQWTLRTKGALPNEGDNIEKIKSKAKIESVSIKEAQVVEESPYSQVMSSAPTSAYETPTPDEQFTIPDYNNFIEEMMPIQDFNNEFDFFF